MEEMRTTCTVRKKGLRFHFEENIYLLNFVITKLLLHSVMNLQIDAMRRGLIY
jgi:hypothetical protein